MSPQNAAALAMNARNFVARIGRSHFSVSAFVAQTGHPWLSASATVDGVFHSQDFIHDGELTVEDFRAAIAFFQATP